jgi:hypothetical protein
MSINLLAAALDPGALLRARGIQRDPWQRELLRCNDRFILLNCRRAALQNGRVGLTVRKNLQKALKKSPPISHAIAEEHHARWFTTRE